MLKLTTTGCELSDILKQKPSNIQCIVPQPWKVCDTALCIKLVTEFSE